MLIGKTTLSLSVFMLIMAPAFAGPIITYDFETDDFGTPLVNGQHISTGPGTQPDTVFEFGKYADVSSTVGPGGNEGAAIFDSTPGVNTVVDDDLWVNTGNILILQDNDHPATTSSNVANGTIFDVPDDEADLDAGSIFFDFHTPVAPLSVKLVDANGGFGGEVILTDVAGGTRTYTIPEMWSFDVSDDGPNGYETLDMTSVAVQPGEGINSVAPPVDAGGYNGAVVAQIEFRFTGLRTASAGIDDLAFMIPEPTAALLTALGAIAALPMLRRRAAKKA